MRAPRVVLLAFVLLVAAVGVWAQPGPFTITPTSLPIGGGSFVVGQTIPLQQLSPNPQLDQSFGWAVSGGALPPGLNLDQVAGTITGVPTVAGAYTFTILAQEIGTNFIAFQQYTLYIASGALNLAPLTSAPAAVGLPYASAPFRAVGGVPNYTWSLQSGANADGLSINPSTGQLSGTPLVGGVFTIPVVITDASGAQASANFTLNVLGVSTTSLPGVTVGTAYSQTLAAAGGTGSLSWAVTGNNQPPPGLTLSSQGQITGTATTSGTFPFVVQVTDSTSKLSATQALSIAVVPPAAISPATLPGGSVNIPYTAALTVQGVQISNWAATVGTLPAGLNLNGSTGAISGTPTAAGSSTFTITATPSAVVAVLPPIVQVFTIVIGAAPTVTITGLPSVGGAASQSTATVALSGAYPADLTGIMTLTFAPASGGSQNYDAKFATGTGTTATFTIPAGSTSANVPVMIGTVAGIITIHTVLQNSTLTAPADINITVNPAVPAITSVTLGAVTTSGFSISVTGRSTPRNMTSAVFHFTAPTNSTLASADITVPLTSAFTTWYGSAASIPFGSSFTMTVQFSYTGPPGQTVPYTTVTVTLTNSVGSSTTSVPVSP